MCGSCYGVCDLGGVVDTALFVGVDAVAGGVVACPLIGVAVVAGAGAFAAVVVAGVDVFAATVVVAGAFITVAAGATAAGFAAGFAAAVVAGTPRAAGAPTAALAAGAAVELAGEQGAGAAVLAAVLAAGFFFPNIDPMLEIAFDVLLTAVAAVFVAFCTPAELVAPATD